jgi:hypothetical protein
MEAYLNDTITFRFVKMSTPNPITSGIVTAAVLGAAKQGQDFIAAVAGYPGESLGTIVGNWTKRRFDNLGAIGNKSHLILLNIGEQPKTDVPLRVLQPLIEAASLEENTELQDIWANLLAHATDPRELTQVRAMFPAILRDLGHRDVQFLDALYAECLRKLAEQEFFTRPSQIGYTMDDLKDLYVKLGFSRVPKLSSASFDEQQNPEYKQDQDAFYLLLDVIQNHDVIRTVIVPNSPRAPQMMAGQRLFHFTELGVQFILACLPPAKSS